MAGNDDPRDLPLDPSDWESTELYRQDDPSIAAAIHDAKTEILDEPPAGMSEVTPAPMAPRRLGPWLWGGAALVVGIGALAVVDHLAGQSNTPSASAPAPARALPAPPPDAGTDAAPAPIPADFTAAFRRNQAAVQGCLVDHAADAGDAERVILRFDIRRDGTVEAARMTPDAIASTELGSCLLAIARGARFAPQQRPIGIRIPITLHRR